MVSWHDDRKIILEFQILMLIKKWKRKEKQTYGTQIIIRSKDILSLKDISSRHWN